MWNIDPWLLKERGGGLVIDRERKHSFYDYEGLSSGRGSDRERLEIVYKGRKPIKNKGEMKRNI